MRYALIPVLLFTGACAQDVLNTKPEVKGLESALAMQTFIEPENGADLTLRPGGQVTIELTSNPTTGYYWTVVEPIDAAVKFVSDNYIADPAPEGIVGSGGRQMIVFEAVSTGTAKLTLSYQRSGNDVAEMRKLDIKVID